MTTEQYASLGLAGGLVGYYFWPAIKSKLPKLGKAKPSRIRAAEHLEQAEQIANDMGCVKTGALCRSAAASLWEGPIDA
jgi:hypothetical protein